MKLNSEDLYLGIHGIIMMIPKEGKMESKDLRFFLEVAKTGSFSQAAINLYSVQSNVTIHIKKIENQYGVKLFNRNNKSVILTPQGEKLFFYAENIIFLLDKAQSMLKNNNTQFCIGTTASISLLLPEFIKQCMKLESSTMVSVKVFTSAELQNKKYTGSLDCIISNSTLDSSFNGKNFQIIENLVLIYPISDLSFESYLKDTIIVSSNPSCSYRKLLFNYLKNKKDNVQILEFDSLLGIINSVELGIGASLVPYKIVENNQLVNKIVIDELKNNTLTVSNNSKSDNLHFNLLIDFLKGIYHI